MCDACELAKRDASHPIFRGDCFDCRARALAQSPTFFYANKYGQMTTAYRQALESCFGYDWEVWHPRVKEWAEQIEKGKK